MQNIFWRSFIGFFWGQFIRLFSSGKYIQFSQQIFFLLDKVYYRDVLGRQVQKIFHLRNDKIDRFFLK